ncbi:sigma-70 family RNA polymerase sigma factor [uncultured Sunxiuqinia sp.]|uniref:RNA polymerase sigma factor n=1 Tax=uncultured Sunxiuqinia sp. TaxID=1573825 RepID=UPI0026282039|nr:sigma-70 family RNA polymerase sigma factor [uncultured Sunxiuqinia sp.]
MTTQNKNWDNSLWNKFQQGDNDALGELFQERFRELYFYGLKLVPVAELVKDTIQDLFTDLWSRKEKVKEIANINAYLMVSLRRELLRRASKIRTQTDLDEASSQYFTFSSEDFIIGSETELETRNKLVAGLRHLTSRQREVIVLRFKHEMEFKEIAQVMDLNVQSVRNLLFRALEKLREEMNVGDSVDKQDVGLVLFAFFKEKIKFS